MKSIIQIKEELLQSEMLKFNNKIPTTLKSISGVYSIWDNMKLIYIGKSTNLHERLNDHRKGNRGGDSFNIYIFDRFILGRLSNEEIKSISEGGLNANTIVKNYIQSKLSYRISKVKKENISSVENELRQFGLGSGHYPFLNKK